jgi:hypothetical protein
MKWKKLGKVWSAKSVLSWGAMGTLTPTPIILCPGIIRVYCGIRDEFGVARIGYFEVEESNPTKSINYSKFPVLELGKPGAFDDNGMLLGDFFVCGDEIRMYYVGFQLGVKAKFLAFGGMAVSKDGGNNFLRYADFPVMDRDDKGLFIRAIHSIRRLENGTYRAWYSEGSTWEIINGKPFPNYNVATIDSPDGLTFSRNLGTKIELELPGEYRLGRSRVFSLSDEKHILTFTYGKTNGEYCSGYAVSNDLKTWVRKSDFGLSPGPDEFDSKHLAYPALIKVSNGSVYCFYNGNDMGAGGIGVAELLSY